MFIMTVVCNVGRSGGNRSLLFSLFCCVSLFFVLEVPVTKDGDIVFQRRGMLSCFHLFVGVVWLFMGGSVL